MDYVIFFIFQPSKICVIPTDFVSSLSPLWCGLSSGQRHHTAAPCHASFPLSQNALTASTSSFANILSHRLSFRAKTEALNPHHRHRLPYPDRSTPILHWYKKIFSTLATPLTTQPRLHFASFLARPHHRSSTHHCGSFLPLSHTHYPFTQWHPRWWTSQSSFVF
jgi:hypothetical protein